MKNLRMISKTIILMRKRKSKRVKGSLADDSPSEFFGGIDEKRTSL